MAGSAFADSTALTLVGGPAQRTAEMSCRSGRFAPPSRRVPKPQGFDAIILLTDEEVIAKCRHRESVLAGWQFSAYGPCRMCLNFLPRLGDLDVPTLWLLGQNDELLDAGEMQAAAAASGGRLENIEDAGYMAALDQPQDFAALAGKFLHDP